MDRWNVKEFVVAKMVDEFGYELIVDEELTEFRRVLDDQHASIFRASMKPGRVSLHFGMARRDINDLRDRLRGPEMAGFEGAPWDPIYYPANDPPFQRMPSAFWLNTREAENDVADWLGLWVPKLESATTLSSIQRGLELVNPRANEKTQRLNRKRMLRPLMLNRMLWGWRGDRDFEEFIRPLELAEHSGSEFHKRTQAFIDRALAWIAEHPNGVEREAVGGATADFAD